MLLVGRSSPGEKRKDRPVHPTMGKEGSDLECQDIISIVYGPRLRNPSFSSIL